MCRELALPAAKSYALPSRLTCVADRGWQRELEDGAVWKIRRRPQLATVGINDRAANRQSHPHALWLGGKERFKELVRPRRVEPGARVLDRYSHAAGLIVGGSDMQLPLPLHRFRHCLNAVHDQIQHDLLKLDAIANDRIEIGGQRGFDSDAMTAELGAHENDYLPDQVVDIDRDHLGRGLAREGSDALDDIPGAVAVSDDASRGLPRFLEIRLVGFEPEQAGVRIGDDCGQRLIDLVRNGCGELTHCTQPRGSFEISQCAPQGLFSDPTLGHVYDRADEFGVVCAVGGCTPQAMHIFCRAIGRYDAKVALEVAAISNRLMQLFFGSWPVLRMNPVREHLVGGRRRIWIQSENAKILSRLPQLPRGHVPGPASGSADSLAFGEKSLAAAQLVLRAPAFRVFAFQRGPG